MDDEDDRKPPAKRSFVAMEDEDVDDRKPSAKGFDEEKDSPNVNAKKRPDRTNTTRDFHKKKKRNENVA